MRAIIASALLAAIFEQAPLWLLFLILIIGFVLEMPPAKDGMHRFFQNVWPALVRRLPLHSCRGLIEAHRTLFRSSDA